MKDFVAVCVRMGVTGIVEGACHQQRDDNQLRAASSQQTMFHAGQTEWDQARGLGYTGERAEEKPSSETY